MMDPLITALVMTEAIRNMERETEKEGYHMDPFIAGIAIHEAAKQNSRHDDEAHHMDPFTLYQYTKIRHEERLKAAASWQRGEPAPSLFWRMFTTTQRAIRTLLATRITLTVHTRRPISEPDVCIE